MQQFGGVSATHLDWTMVPYVRKSFFKHFRDGLKYIEKLTSGEISEKLKRIEHPEDVSIEADAYALWTEASCYAVDKTFQELEQAVEGMYHNLNTL